MLSTRKTDQKNIYILAFTLVVVMLGFGLVIPILPFYIQNMGAGGSELGLLIASYAVMRLIFGPIWGSLSDRIGRKPVLLIGILGYGITMIGFGLATELWMLFVFRALSGILSSATSPTTMAYISDSTAEADRGRGMGILGAATGLGTIIGPGVGGLLGEDALSVPFFIAGGMSLLAMLLIAVFLPESLPPEKRAQSSDKSKRFHWQMLWESLSSPVGAMLVMAFLISYAATLFSGIFGIYAADKYHYGPKDVGVIMMIVGLVMALAQAVLAGPLSQRFKETAIIKAALLATGLSFLAMAWARSTLGIYLSIGFFSLAVACLSPAISSLTSKWTTLEQGLTMGLSNAFMSLGRIFGPLGSGLLYDLDMDYPYLSGAVVMLLGFGYALWSVREKAEKLVAAKASE